jgi:HEAT repeat protein
LTETLSHRDNKVAWAAAQGLSQFGEAGFQALLRATVASSGPRQLERAVIALGRWGDARATVALRRAVEREQAQRSKGTTWAVILGVLCTPLAFLWFATSSARSTTLREHVAEALGNIGDLRAVGMLAQFANARSASLSGAGTLALIRLLPLFDSVSREQMFLLASDTVPALASLLSHSNLTLVRHALCALRNVGDGRALPAVERLANTRSLNDAERNYLADEARLLIPLLYERAVQDENRYTLLRGTTAPVASPQELLRPAQGHTGPDDRPDELLRPSSS